VVNDEEFRIVKDLSDAKKAYRAGYDKFSAAKESLAGITSEINARMADQLRDFETWYAANTGGLLPLATSPRAGGAGGGGAAAGATGLSRTAASGYGSGDDSPFKSAPSSPGGRGGFGGPSLADSSLVSGSRWMPGVGSGGGGAGFGDDALDDGEAFERMEMERVVGTEPDSLAYFNATKRLRQGAKYQGRRNMSPVRAVASSGGKH
jgi:hypothetical protein